jgi:hypothetical protein
MSEGEHSGFRDLVSPIAVCGLVLLAVLSATLWSGSAQRWLGPLQDWLPMAPSLEEGSTRAPKAPAAAWSDNEIKAALMHCVQALAPVTTDAVPLDPILDGNCGAPAPVLLKSVGDVEQGFIRSASSPGLRHGGRTRSMA